MAQIVRTFLFTSIFFGICMGLVNLMWFRDSTSVVVVSVLQGIGYGFFMTLFLIIFANSAQVKKSATPTFEVGEQIIHEAGANHFKGLEGVGGRLYLTSQRLVFKSHSFNFQNHVLSLPLHQIQYIRPVLTIGLIPNGLQIQTQDGCVEKFVVEDRQGWINKITAAL